MREGCSESTTTCAYDATNAVEPSGGTMKLLDATWRAIEASIPYSDHAIMCAVLVAAHRVGPCAPPSAEYELTELYILDSTYALHAHTRYSVVHSTEE